MFALFIFSVWAVVSLLPILEGKARHQSTGTSIFPGLPVLPLIAWGLAEWMDWFHPQLGYYTIGGLHLALMIVAGAFALKYWFQRSHRGR